MTPIEKQIKAIRFALVVLAAICIVGFIQTSQQQLDEIQRLRSSVFALNTGMKTIQLSSGKLAAGAGVVQVQTDQLRESFPQIVEAIQRLDLKVGKARQVNTVASQTTHTIKTFLRDSVIYDSVKVKSFEYKDSYLTLHGIQMGDSQRVHLELTDTLSQVIFKGKRLKPYLWIFSPRILEQRAALSNPSARLTYLQTLQISRR